jgi:hypothetical protein
MDEFGIECASEIFDDSSPLWDNKVVLPRTGLCLPDIMCCGFSERGDKRCLLSIQVKTINEPPSSAKDEHINIYSMVLNTSYPHFFTETDNSKKEYTKIWEYLNKKERIHHLRVLVCWAGFTE